MAPLYNTPIPEPDGKTYGLLGPILEPDSAKDPELLWFEFVGLIPNLLADHGGILEFAGLERALFGDEMKQRFDPKQIPLLVPYIEAISNAIMTLRRAGIIEYHRTSRLLILWLVEHHE